MIGAHLGTARTLALAEQGFYWPGMRADVSRICNECDCAMLKRRRGRREPLHQYVVGVPMERLAMDVAGPYPVTSAGNQYCLMVGCYFSKWLECFPIPDQKATTVARKLVFEIVARYGAFRELHSDQGTNFGSKVVLEVCRLFGIHKTRTTPYHPRSDGFIERRFESGVPRDEAGVGRARATDPDELPGDATSEHRSDPQHDDVGSADEASGPGYVWSTPGTGRGSQHSERVRGRTPRRIAGGVPARKGGVATGSVAPETRLRRQGPEARVPSRRAGMDPRHNAGKNTGNEAAVPMVRPGPHHQGVG